MRNTKEVDEGRHRLIGLGSGCFFNEKYPNCNECALTYMKIRRVCMNFIRLVETVFEMYAGIVGWPAPASMSADWPPYPWTAAVANLRVGVGNALSACINSPAKRRCIYKLYPIK